jgi:hypothetical protein
MRKTLSRIYISLSLFLFIFSQSSYIHITLYFTKTSHKMRLFTISLLFLSPVIPSDGFTIDKKCIYRHSRDVSVSMQDESSSVQCRRSWLASQLSNMFLATGVLSLTNSSPASAAMSSDQKVFKVGDNLTVDQAKERFSLARKDVQYLLDNYASVSKEGGDAVRRLLGTVGTSGSMYGISKVVMILRDEAEDIVEFTELNDEFNAYLYQAEGAAYLSIFAEHSSAKATPESCLAMAKQDVIMMAKYMDQLQAQLN